MFKVVRFGTIAFKKIKYENNNKFYNSYLRSSDIAYWTCQLNTH